MALRRESQVDLAPLLVVGVASILVAGVWGGVEFFKYLRRDKQAPQAPPATPPDGGEIPSS